MPLSKARDKERKRKSRLERQVSPPGEMEVVQPKIVKEEVVVSPVWVNGDGNEVWDD